MSKPNTLTVLIVGTWIVFPLFAFSLFLGDNSPTILLTSIIATCALLLVSLSLSVRHLYIVARNRAMISWFPATIGALISVASAVVAVILLFSWSSLLVP